MRRFRHKVGLVSQHGDVFRRKVGHSADIIGTMTAENSVAGQFHGCHTQAWVTSPVYSAEPPEEDGRQDQQAEQLQGTVLRTKTAEAALLHRSSPLTSRKLRKATPTPPNDV